MSEVIDQIMSGGPVLISASWELPALEKMMKTPKVIWALYRLDERLRVILSQSSPMGDTFREYGEFYALTHRVSYPLMTEREGRQVLAWLAGESTSQQFRAGLHTAIRDHLDYLIALGDGGFGYLAAMRLLSSVAWLLCATDQ